MDCQDWTPVTVRRHYSKKEPSQYEQPGIYARDPTKNERIHMAKLADSDIPVVPKKRITSESLQSLIRKRIELKLTQEKADNMCAFPRNTFKEIESHRLLPDESKKRRILLQLGVQLKTETISA